jgi:hypothetical protein
MSSGKIPVNKDKLKMNVNDSVIGLNQRSTESPWFLRCSPPTKNIDKVDSD